MNFRLNSNVYCTVKLEPMLESEPAERRLIAHFVDALRALPELEVDALAKEWPSKHGSRRYDVRIELRVAGKPLVLLIEAMKTAFPRDVRHVIWQIQAANHGMPTAKGGDRAPPRRRIDLAQRKGVTENRGCRLLR